VENCPSSLPRTRPADILQANTTLATLGISARIDPRVWLLMFLAGCSTTVAVPPAARRSPQSAPVVVDPPARHVVAKPIVESPPSLSPPVLLSTGQAALCQVGVGEPLPPMAPAQLDGKSADFTSMRGERATVILFWNQDRWMAETALGDLEHDVARVYPTDKVTVVGVATGESPQVVRKLVAQSGASFPQLLDPKGAAFAAVGKHALPRVYVLDGADKIVWFDIEYSQATHRELLATITALAAE
jgi:hypothetical protein